jgi:hypothetical protein
MQNQTVMQLQSQRMSSAKESKSAAEDEQAHQIQTQREYTNEVYQQRMTEAEKNYEAAKEEQLGNLIGGIICPIIGSLLGKAIGHATGNGERDDALNAKSQAGEADIRRDKASDLYQEAVDSYSEASDREAEVEKFGKDMRQAEQEASFI